MLVPSLNGDPALYGGAQRAAILITCGERALLRFHPVSMPVKLSALS
jgi:hypothetical protein